MNADRFRALADRCKELARLAARDDIRQQLREWTHEFEAEAEAVEEMETVHGRKARR
jgi:hypothetical protein